MPRFYLPPSSLHGKSFTLSGSEAHHALHVLRKKIGDEIDLFDGQDAAFKGRIDSVESQEIRGTILEDVSPSVLPVEVTLYQALARGPKWEWLLEKACEIGVARVVPVFTQRTLIKLDAAGAREKVKRWNRIALAASKQCGRANLMTVETPVPLATALSQLDKTANSIIPWEKENKQTIHEALRRAECGVRDAEEGSLHKKNHLPNSEPRTPHAVNIFIGPEGGWDASEVDLALRSGLTTVRLGPTLLRTETAGVVAATLVLREFGVY